MYIKCLIIVPNSISHQTEFQGAFLSSMNLKNTGSKFEPKNVNILLSISCIKCFGCSKEPSQCAQKIVSLRQFFWVPTTYVWLRNEKVI